MAQTIALVSCVKVKRPHSCRAADLYVSPLFLKMRSFAERHADRWFVLSAKYGLVDPESVIAPYEQTLNAAGVRERRAWAARVYGQMESACLFTPGTSFLWLAGAKYKEHLSQLLRHHHQHDPLVGKKIGERLSWLNAALRHP